ncbi:MAG: phosphoenolpyruvate carboxylase [Steroidobacteraceae bacterium]
MDRHQIQFPPKHLALREDVHQLGVLVGEMLREQGGDELFTLVEADRRAAIERRNGAEALTSQLEQQVAGRPPAIARDLVRAFSTWFQAVNLAEKVHRIRRRREYFLADGGRPQPGGIEDALAQIKAQGLSLDEVLQLLGELRIEPILVSHPTESPRRTQLRRWQRMAGALLDRLNPNLDPQEQRHAWARLRTEITAGWQTEEHPRQRLTIADEREFAMFHFAEVLYRIVPTFYEEIGTALTNLYGMNVSSIDPPIVLRFGTWVGGDMEGAPDVHAKTIRETLARQQQVVVQEYFRECQQLSQLLSQSASRVPISAELQRRIDEYAILLPGARSIAPTRHDQMPYRVFFAHVAERLRQTYELQANRYERVEQFRADLMLAAQSLQANRGVSAGYQLVRRLLLRVDSFGFHLATLDLKQRADVHHRVIGQGMDDPQWLRRSRSERTSGLADMLRRDIGPAAPLDALSRRTLAVFEAAMHCRARFGARAIGNYVVAGTEGPDDILAPLVLARWAGVDDRRSGAVGMDFAPLFESGDSLRAAGQVMREVLSNADYREHLAARATPQPLWIGYSEAGRDGGYLAMRMAAYDAQRSLVETFKAAQQPVSIRHARGGSTARGGSRLDAMIRASPPETIDGTLHITEQGEIISQNYGLNANALRSLERAFGVLGMATLARRRGTVRVERPEHHTLVSALAAHSRKVWRALLVDDHEFNDFFRAVTPIDVIEKMQIGSRSIWECANSGSGVLTIRSTPWVFAWSQARYFLPGWYGAGTALHDSIAAEGLPRLREVYDDWPFFALVIDDIEAQLARTDTAIAERYGELASQGLRRYITVLREEFQRTREAVLAIKDESDLLDGDRTQQRAIQLRNPYVDPMNLMQVDLLRRWRATAREDEDLFKALLASVSGIAQGLQTTG